jgi:hypothetical protein
VDVLQSQVVVDEECGRCIAFLGECSLQLGGCYRHGLMLSLSIAKWPDSLNSQSLVYNGDRQAPQDLLNLLPEGTDSDPDIWLTGHKSIPAFPHRKASASSNRRSFGSKRYFWRNS